MEIVDPSPDYITLSEAVALTRRTRETIRRAVQSGALPRRYVIVPNGRRLVFQRAELLRWLLDRRQ